MKKVLRNILRHYMMNSDEFVPIYVDEKLKGFAYRG